MTIQLIFNNQKWGNESKEIGKAAARLDELMEGKVEVDFLPAMYSNFTNIPFVVNMVPMSPETADAPDPIWMRNNIFPMNKNADILIFVVRDVDWNDNNPDNGHTYGYCYNQYPATFPPFIPLNVESGDKSWKFKNLTALEHYIPHEIAHCFSRILGLTDNVHPMDYSGHLADLYKQFNYDTINYALEHKRNIEEPMYIFQKEGAADLYFAVGNVLVPFAATFETFQKDFKDAIIIKLLPDEFLKFKVANYNLVVARKV